MSKLFFSNPSRSNRIKNRILNIQPCQTLPNRSHTNFKCEKETNRKKKQTNIVNKPVIKIFKS